MITINDKISTSDVAYRNSLMVPVREEKCNYSGNIQRRSSKIEDRKPAKKNQILLYFHAFQKKSLKPTNLLRIKFTFKELRIQIIQSN